jgi:hypothetical protein
VFFAFASVDMLHVDMLITVHAWDETDKIMVYELLDMLFNSIYQDIIQDFLLLCSLKRLAYNFLFLLCPCLVLG